ncbi:hypothetical protein CC85DRAFT_284347 [Cutaneotrichosporon oleaginosum]|uniref:protein-tyrosine-phosphatase n=1 Tax=Cutaneotrichosporon oleaginosum TaxID=879819 RepID=A0A0J0XRB7_9TREE|nr:uncharacterized protein CC85DRAFT_284347 [Cutaneotrichosporon oleaginosum]KLT43638.1 hypothetical protein CC85DRAFT_284347 [Cutaneotrichosporon oleaginosum]TXT12695.1 hypothetical protein COLE_03105 [Cutaneotrichosporon oleaginosum]
MLGGAGSISSTSTSIGVDAPGSSASSAPLSPRSPPRSPSLAATQKHPPSSPPTLDSIATAKSSQYSTFLRTPITPIMTHCFVDSPAEVSTSFAAFHSFVAHSSSLSSIDIPLTPEGKPPSAACGERGIPSGPSDAAPGKKRPSPLSLPDDNIELDAPLTSKSTESILSSELEQLRRSVHQNLRERPLGISVEDSDSEFGEAASSAASTSSSAMLDGDRCISPVTAFAQVRSSPQTLVVDTRPRKDFLSAHVPHSVHFSIPSLIYSRQRRQLDEPDPESGAAAWSSLGAFVSSPAGRAVWNGVDLKTHLDVIIVGADRYDEAAPCALANILEQIVSTGTVRVLKGGWTAAAPLAEAEGLRVARNPADASFSDSTPLALAPTVSPPEAGSGASTPMAMALSPTEPPPGHLPQSAFTGGAPAPSQMGKRGSVSSQSSTSSSSSGGSSFSPMRRSLPQLSLNAGAPQQARRPPPKLSLNVGPSNAMLAPSGGPKRSFNARASMPGKLTLDIGESSRLSVPSGPMSALQTQSGATGLTPTHPSVQAISAGLTRASGEPWQDSLRSSLPAGHIYQGGSYSSGAPTPSVLRQGPIEVSTVLPGFLYLGPEISTRADVEVLLSMGIRRVLNVALECDDDEGLGLRTAFERYYRIPMKDSVEESGVGQGIRDACDFLDDARLHDAPVYVHCKAGKSRSVTVVLAYLIHANAWTLKTSYAYVAERRHGISPNIGFVAELIQFEETELGNKGKGGESGSQSQLGHGEAQAPEVSPHPQSSGSRYTRESLPPEWGREDKPSSNQSIGPPVVAEPEHTPEGISNRRQKQSAADIEVRKNGQWVHGRRAPVDRTTLQPGRRVSKAGLESMMMRPLEPSSRSKS